MNKIFYYELRRLLWNKFFIGLLIINGVYAWTILTTDTIAGTAHTAPFSPWSFGSYLGKVMPISILTVMFLLSLYYSKKEKHTQTLTSATPVSRSFYLLIRSAALTLCFLIICAVIIALSFYFYTVFFDYRNFAAFVTPALLILPPCFIFAMALGHLAGRIHLSLLYILMLVLLALGFAGIGGNLDFFGTGYFNSYPLTLPAGADGEPAFVLSAGFQTARVIYFVLGGVLLALAHWQFRKHGSQKA